MKQATMPFNGLHGIIFERMEFFMAKTVSEM
jgi:hypothetical protein